MSDDIERRVTDLERRQEIQDAKFEMFMKSMDDFKAEMRDFKTEMRDRDNQRAAEIRALQIKQDNDIKELRKETDAKIDKLEASMTTKFNQLEAKMDSVNQYAHQMFIAAAIGIGAMILTVVAPLIIASIKDADKPAPSPAIHTQLELPRASDPVDGKEANDHVG